VFLLTVLRVLIQRAATLFKFHGPQDTVGLTGTRVML
jgi:hypothetical protein